MEVEFTARQVQVPKALRSQTEEGMDRIARIMGRSTRASVVFRAQRHLQIVELTLKARVQTIVATGKATNLESALRQAVSHAENQALRYRDRQLVKKRLPKEEKVLSAPPVARPKARIAESESLPVNGRSAAKAKAKTRDAVRVDTFPAPATVDEPHVLKTVKAIASKPMTIEEAVKDAEASDRDLLVFHSPVGELFVLHRRRDGHMELVEVP